MQANEFVFIVGLPRTGSTLLRTLLNRSDCISIAAETHFLHQYARLGRKKRLLRFGNLDQEQGMNLFLDDLFNPKRASGKDFWAWLNNNISRAEFRERLRQTDCSDQSIFELLIRIHAEKKKDGNRPGMTLGEKTAANIYYVPELLRWYPDARIIHTFRDPRGIFISALKLVKDGKWGVKARIPAVFPNPVRNLLLEMIMAVYILRIWLDATRLHARYARLYPQQYLLVKFEDLLQDPEGHIRRVCEFLNVPFERSMIEEVSSIGSSFTTQRIVGGAGFEKSAADSWKKRINPIIRGWLTVISRRQLEDFGYDY